MVSVLLPINRALPYLTEAVRDIVKQDLHGRSLELICSWDGGRRADWAWLLELAAALEISVQEIAAAPAADREAFRNDEVSLDGYPSVEDVAAAKRPEHSVKIVKYKDGANRGQGAAMSLALSVSTAPIIAQMEADDTRPRCDALRLLVEAIETKGWDGACTSSACFGAVTDGMRRYVEWQNSLVAPSELAAARFVEIPALHQTAAFRRDAVERVLADGAYRDGTVRGDSHDAKLDTPVDLWWWLSFFDRGLTCGRVVGDDLFGWRQHDAQRTRSQGRLSIANLRKIKIHWLLKLKPAAVMVVSVGATLRGWLDDIAAHPNKPPGRLRSFEWRPSKRASAGAFVPTEITRAACDDPSAGLRTTRLFAYGNAAVRARIRLHVDDWDPAFDYFVA